MQRKFISIKYIIESLYRNLNLEREPHWLDWIEWAAEALEYIDTSAQYTIRSTDDCDRPYLEITCHKAPLPSDFVAIIEPVIMNGKVLLPNDNAKIYASYDSETTYTYNSVPVDSSIAPRLITTSEVGGTDYYTILDGCIVTSIPSGSLIVNYYAIPTDEDGYPMVPDEYYYKEAIKAYITYRIYHPLWLAGSVTDRVYNELKSRWIYLGQAARNNAKMPSVGETEKLKRQWVRLIPNMNSFNNGFRDLDQEQKRTLQ